MVNVDDDKERRFLLSNIFSNDDGNCNGYWTTTPTTTIDHNRQFSGDGDLNSIKTTNGNEVVVVVEQKDNHDKRKRASNIDWRTPMDQFDCHSNECNQFGTLVHTFGNYRKYIRKVFRIYPYILDYGIASMDAFRSSSFFLLFYLFVVFI